MSTQQLNYLNITNRSEIDIKGVKDILSYDSDKIVLLLDESNLIICGADFNVKKLDVETKTASITGHVNSITYTSFETKSSGKFLSSLFR